MTHSERAILDLLDQRGPGKTICPSEVARKLQNAAEDWRDHMESVHEASDTLLQARLITLSWKGEFIKKRRGPYRIARRE